MPGQAGDFELAEYEWLWSSLAEMASVEAIGEQFISSYYQLFDTNRAGLGQLYVSA